MNLPSNKSIVARLPDWAKEAETLTYLGNVNDMCFMLERYPFGVMVTHSIFSYSIYDQEIHGRFYIITGEPFEDWLFSKLALLVKRSQ